MKKVSLYFLCTVVLCLWVFFSVQNTFAQESRSLVAQKMIANILLATDNGNDHVALVERYYLVEDMLTREDISSTVRKNSQQVVSFLREYIDQKKQKTHKESTIAYAIFYDEHITNVTSSGVDLPQRCFEYYDLVDDVAWSKDIPTNLVIATWMMEASCGFYFPANGDGPFQMLYKNET